MRCEDIDQLASAYIEGELSVEEEKALLEHIATCSSCQETVEMFRQIKTHMHCIDEITLPEGFHESVMNRIETATCITPEETKKASQYKVYKGLTYIATLAAVFVGGLFMLRSEKVPNDQTMRSSMTADSQMPQAAPVDANQPRAQKQEAGWDLAICVTELQSFEKELVEWAQTHGEKLLIEETQDEKVHYIRCQGNVQTLYDYLSPKENVRFIETKENQRVEETGFLIKVYME